MADLSANGGKIEYQQETVGIGPDGRAVEGVKIGFVTALGLHGSVFIDKARYNPVNAKAEATAAANQMDAVHKLPI